MMLRSPINEWLWLVFLIQLFEPIKAYLARQLGADMFTQSVWAAQHPVACKRWFDGLTVLRYVLYFVAFVFGGWKAGLFVVVARLVLSGLTMIISLLAGSTLRVSAYMADVLLIPPLCFLGFVGLVIFRI